MIDLPPTVLTACRTERRFSNLESWNMSLRSCALVGSAGAPPPDRHSDCPFERVGRSLPGLKPAKWIGMAVSLNFLFPPSNRGPSFSR